MSRSAAQAGGSSAGLRSAGAIVFVIAMALVVLLLVRARPGPEPFDPRSGQPSGARGLVLTLQAAGGDVDATHTVPSPDEPTRVLVLEDRLDSQQRQDLLDFAQRGGIVVVADPESSLHGGSGLDGGAIRVSGQADSGGNQRAAELELNVALGVCTVESLSELRGVFVPDGVLFPVGPGEEQCFTDERLGERTAGHSFVIVRSFGAGLIIGLGDNEPFINRNLRRADNAGLAVALLVPARNSNVTFLLGNGVSPPVSDVGSGDETLRDLVPPWVWMSLALSAIAFVVFAVSRSTRVGRLVTEPIAAPIAGSELVSATGNLMERAGHAPRAGWLLLERLHRDLCRAHAVDFSAPLADLDRVVHHRHGTQPGGIEALLRRTVSDAGGLTSLSADIDRVRRDVFGQPEGVPDASTASTSAIGDHSHERVTTP